VGFHPGSTPPSVETCRLPPGPGYGCTAVQHTAEGKNIGADVGDLAVQLLGRNVLQRPDDGTALRQSPIEGQRVLDFRALSTYSITG